jgi:hypothetical protein
MTGGGEVDGLRLSALRPGVSAREQLLKIQMLLGNPVSAFTVPPPMMTTTLKKLLSIAAMAALFCGASLEVLGAESTAPEISPVFEIRNYHFDPELVGEYEAWARDIALPFIRKKVDVVGFWVDAGLDPQINGAPLDEMGSANVTWIIRWKSKAERDEKMGGVFSGPEWDVIAAKIPGGRKSYLRVEAKFFKEL